MVVQVFCMVERPIGMGAEVLDYGRKIIVRYEGIYISPR